MNQADQIKLIKKHAPIFWLHELEAFVPEDCKVMVEISDLYRKKKREDNQPSNLNDLGKITNSEECYLKVKDLDMKNFTTPTSYHQRISRLGPEGVAEMAREKYGHNFFLNGFPSDNPHLPKYYARVSDATIRAEEGDPFTKFYQSKDPQIFGHYTLIEYFFFFVFNDAWNKHQGDWDSMVQLYIKEDRKYMITYFHECKWVSQLPVSSLDINSWLKGWSSLKKNEIGESYVMKDHPYVFVALGAHGGYPTPGFTIHGVNLPEVVTRSDFLANTDERQIGQLCILPEDINEEIIRTNLRIANIEANKIKFGRWKEPELIDKQAWLKYKGKWGEDTKYFGWDGPQNPRMTRPPNKGSLKETIQSGYYGGSVLVNWHGVR